MAKHCIWRYQQPGEMNAQWLTTNLAMPIIQGIHHPTGHQQPGQRFGARHTHCHSRGSRGSMAKLLSNSPCNHPKATRVNQEHRHRCLSLLRQCSVPVACHIATWEWPHRANPSSAVTGPACKLATSWSSALHHPWATHLPTRSGRLAHLRLVHLLSLLRRPTPYSDLV